MIVKMKKASLVVLESEIEESMERLRDAGIMHLNLSVEENDKIAELQGKRTILEKSVTVLPDSDKDSIKHPPKSINSILEIADKIQDLSSQESLNREEISLLERDIQKVSPWTAVDSSMWLIPGTTGS